MSMPVYTRMVVGARVILVLLSVVIAFAIVVARIAAVGERASVTVAVVAVAVVVVVCAARCWLFPGLSCEAEPELELKLGVIMYVDACCLVLLGCCSYV
jgi:membrane protein YdbS with pleckstrin-like domain